MADYVKVVDANDLVRDLSSGAILNTDSAGYQNYIERRQKLKAQKELVQRQQDTINNLTTEVSELKAVVHKLITSLNKDSTRGQ